MTIKQFLGGRCRRVIEGNHNIVGEGNEATRIAWLKERIKQIPAGSRILDAGAGEQRFKPLCAHLKYVAQDFAQYDGRGDGRGLQTGSWEQSKLDLICDITAIPQPDASFDAIMCIEVFEHLPNPILALREFARLLRPDGCLLLTAPFCSITHFAPYHFCTGFSRYFYDKHLPEHGFAVEEICANGNFYEYLAQELRRIPDVNRQYSIARLHVWERVACRIVLAALQRCSRHDQSSAELLCFGYQVRAVRKRDPQKV